VDALQAPAKMPSTSRAIQLHCRCGCLDAARIFDSGRFNPPPLGLRQQHHERLQLLRCQPANPDIKFLVADRLASDGRQRLGLLRRVQDIKFRLLPVDRREPPNQGLDLLGEVLSELTPQIPASIAGLVTTLTCSWHTVLLTVLP
jgi:hypothetical protein